MPKDCEERKKAERKKSLDSFLIYFCVKRTKVYRSVTKKETDYTKEDACKDSAIQRLSWNAGSCSSLEEGPWACRSSLGIPGACHD